MMKLSDTETGVMDTFFLDLGTENFEDNLRHEHLKMIKKLSNI